MPHILVRSSRISDGARALRTALGNSARLSHRDRAKNRFRWIINWGSTTPMEARGRVLNAPTQIAIASDKVLALVQMREAGVPVPQFVLRASGEDKPTRSRGQLWLGRHKLRASGGRGIEVLRTQEEIDACKAPLLVRYIKKSVELRIHVVMGEAIFLQFKRRDSTAQQEADDRLIRNHDNGWVFCPRGLHEAPVGSVDAAIAAVRALGLDFGAVDIVIDRDNGKPYVLEVNTAPGLQSPTLLGAYSFAFRRHTG